MDEAKLHKGEHILAAGDLRNGKPYNYTAATRANHLRHIHIHFPLDEETRQQIAGLVYDGTEDAEHKHSDDNG